MGHITYCVSSHGCYNEAMNTTVTLYVRGEFAARFLNLRGASLGRDRLFDRILTGTHPRWGADDFTSYEHFIENTQISA